MTEGPTLPEIALEFMREDEPSAETIAGLSGLGPATFEALIRALERRDLLDHLEALAELPAAGKDTRKAAGAAAYRLRSRGVKPRRKAPPAEAQAGDAAAATEPVDLGFVALVAPPGLLGRFWFLLGSLPGAQAVEVKGDADGGIEGIEVLRPVSPSKLEKLAREFARKSVRGMPVRASADVALRLLQTWSATLPAERLPPLWREVEAWQAAARALGADPERAAARLRIGPEVAAMAPESLYAFMGGGIHLPTPAVLQRVLAGMREMLDKPALESAQVETRAHDLTRDSVGGWLSHAAVRTRLARWAEATADAAWAQNEPSAAMGFLRLAEQLGPAADGYALVATPFFRALTTELLGSAPRAPGAEAGG